MITKNKTQVTKDQQERSILISREFNAPLNNVWRAFTESEILDQWWGPAPWRAETKYMDFSIGGYWLYAMVGPENQKHWGRMNYLDIKHHKSFDVQDFFCDENGNINSALPVSDGKNVFTEIPSGTLVEFKVIYATENDLQKIVEMGFEEGITLCFEQLDNLLAK